MKQFIVGAALIVVLMFCFVFTGNIDQVIEEKTVLRHTAQDMANAASLYYDYERFGDGYMVFDETDGNAAAFSVLDTVYNLNDSTYIPENTTFFKDAFSLKITYFDDSLTARQYVNGVLVNAWSFDYATANYTDNKGITKRIFCPTIFIELDAGSPDMQLSVLQNKVLLKTTASYVYQFDSF